MVITAFLLITFGFCQAFAITTVRPHYQFENGDVFKYICTIDTNTSQMIKEQLVKRHEKCRINYTFEVSETTNRENYQVTAQFDSISFQLDSPFEQYTYDLNSSMEDLPPSIQPYSNFVGESCTMNFSNKATVQPIPISYWQKNRPTDGNHLLQLLQGTSQENRIFEINFPNIITDIFIPYPPSPREMQLNESWKHQVTLTNGLVSPTAKATYTIGEIGANTYKINATGKSTLNFKRTSKVNNGKAVVIIAKFKGSMEETIEIDKNSGLPILGDTRINMSGSTIRFTDKIPTTLQILIHFERSNK